MATGRRLHVPCAGELVQAEIELCKQGRKQSSANVSLAAHANAGCRGYVTRSRR